MKNQYVKLVEEINSAKEHGVEDQEDTVDLEDGGENQEVIADIEDKRKKGELGYNPGLTAISRSEGKSSTISKVIDKKQLIEKGSRILHAGAGRPNNPDRMFFDELSKDEAGNANTYHYDPSQKGSDSRDPLGAKNFDVVVSPFVLNVLAKEDREEAIKDMVDSLKDDGFAIVGVRGINDISNQKKDNWIEWSDGYLIPKGKEYTFQKGYTPEELQHELEPYFETVDVVYKNLSVPMVKAQGPKR